MSNISSPNMDQVLSEMRRLTAAAQSTPTEQAQNVSSGDNFATMLKQSIDSVNETQKTAGQLSTAFSSGVPGVELGEVMISLQKAGVAFQAMTEVRNKLVSAYQDIMNMPV